MPWVGVSKFSFLLMNAFEEQQLPPATRPSLRTLTIHPPTPPSIAHGSAQQTAQHTHIHTFSILKDLILCKDVRRWKVFLVWDHILEFVLVQLQPLANCVPDGFPWSRWNENSTPNVHVALKLGKSIRVFAKHLLPLYFAAGDPVVAAPP